MADYKEIVTGVVVARDGGGPVPRAEVEVYDKDLLHNDHLGTAVTDAEGRFHVAFAWSDYKDAFLEGRPDIFVKVRNPQTGETTKTAVYDELNGTLDNDDVETFDLGTIEVD